MATPSATKYIHPAPKERSSTLYTLPSTSPVSPNKDTLPLSRTITYPIYYPEEMDTYVSAQYPLSKLSHNTPTPSESMKPHIFTRINPSPTPPCTLEDRLLPIGSGKEIPQGISPKVPEDLLEREGDWLSPVPGKSRQPKWSYILGIF